MGFRSLNEPIVKQRPEYMFVGFSSSHNHIVACATRHGHFSKRPRLAIGNSRTNHEAVISDRSAIQGMKLTHRLLNRHLAAPLPPVVYEAPGRSRKPSEAGSLEFTDKRFLIPGLRG